MDGFSFRTGRLIRAIGAWLYRHTFMAVLSSVVCRLSSGDACMHKYGRETNRVEAASRRD